MVKKSAVTDDSTKEVVTLPYLRRFALRVRFLEPILGAQSTQQITKDFIAKRAGIELPEDEEALLPEKLERASTVFHRQNESPVLLNYQLGGFLKEAARVRNGYIVPKGGRAPLKNLQNKVTKTVFVFPRYLPLVMPEGVNFAELEKTDGFWNERPLRAETMQGPRVALARSEQLPAGTWFDAEINLLQGEIDEVVLRDLLRYGRFKGIGQWRNAGWGAFDFALAALPETPETSAI